MTDRELLELAAKAAGIKLARPQDYDDRLRNVTGSHPQMNLLTAPIWNPRTDDGDSQRLAVKLHLEIEHNDPLDNMLYVCVSRCGIEMVRDPVRVIEEIEDESDRLDATRRAIVRAAAEIGKAMP